MWMQPDPCFVAFTDYIVTLYIQNLCDTALKCAGSWVVHTQASRGRVGNWIGLDSLLKAWYIALLDFDVVFNQVHPHSTIICRSIPLGESLVQYATIMTFTD
jgi:hypothetical protein